MKNYSFVIALLLFASCAASYDVVYNPFGAHLQLIQDQSILNCYNCTWNGTVAAANVTYGTFGAGNYRFQNNLTIGTSSIINPTTLRQGIGTLNPILETTSAVGIEINNPASAASEIRLRNAATGNATTDGTIFQIGTGATAYIWNYENTALQFATKGISRQTIASTGAVSFTTDNNAITTTCSDDITGAALRECRFGVLSYNSSVFSSPIGYMYVGASSDTNADLILGGGTAAMGSMQTVRFHTGATANTTSGTERARFTANGGFLVGTTTETGNKLTVSSTMTRVAGNNYANYFATTMTQNSTSGQGMANIFATHAYAVSATDNGTMTRNGNGNIWAEYNLATAGSTTANLNNFNSRLASFSAAANISSFAHYGAYVLSGSEYINDVFGIYIAAQKAATNNITNGWGVYQVGTSDKNYFAGNVGINTALPQSTLQVRSGMAAAALESLNTPVFSMSSSTVRSLLSATYWGSTNYYNPIWIQTNDVTRLTIANGTGYIGINTTAPSYPLDVYANASGISIYASGNISATGYITRTKVYTDYHALDKIKNASKYLTPTGAINHSAFDYSYVTYKKKKVIGYTPNNYTDCWNVTDGEGNVTVECKSEIIETPITQEVTEEGVDLVAEVALLKQALYEAKLRIEALEKK